MKLILTVRGPEIVVGILFAIGCGIICGLAPAIQLARSDIAGTLKAGARGAGSARSWFRSLLVGSEICAALLVLVLTGLFLKSYRNSRVVDPGFTSRRVLLAGADLLAEGYDNPTAQRFVRDVLPRLQALPDVESAAISNSVPLDLIIKSLPEQVKVGPARQALAIDTLVTAVSPNYFETLGISVLEGVDFSPFNKSVKIPEAVINDELARRIAPGRSALGTILTLGQRRLRVVGVVQSSKYNTLNEGPTPMVYVGILDQFWESPTMTMFVKTKVPPLMVEPAVLGVVQDLAPGLRLNAVRSLEQHLNDNLFLIRMPAWMLGTLWPSALLLAAIGIYSVVSYSVSRRTQEIGVRLALGATPQGVVRLIMRQGMVAVAVGLALGLWLAFSCSKFLSPSLVQVPAGDPSIFMPVFFVVLAVALMACWVPARRAARTNPTDALRID